MGRMRVRSRITLAEEDLEYAVVHLGDHNLSGGVRVWQGSGPHAVLQTELRAAFGRADIAEVLRALERHFPATTYTLRTLFRDEQKKILDQVLAATLSGVERNYEQIYIQFAPLMRYLASLGQPVPKALHQAAEYTLTARLRRELERGAEIDLEVATALRKEAKDAGVSLEPNELGRVAQRTLHTWLEELTQHPDDVARVERIAAFAAFVKASGLVYDPAATQNRFYKLRETVYRARRNESMKADTPALEAWLSAFVALGEELGVQVEDVD